MYDKVVMDENKHLLLYLEHNILITHRKFQIDMA